MTVSSSAKKAKALPGQVARFLVNKKENFQVAIQSRENFHRYLKTPGSRDDPETSKWSWTNEDLLPTPAEKRNWGYRNYFFLYFSWSMDNWTLGSTMIGIGLNWWQSILVIFGSQMISSIFQAINSRTGAVYHIGFPTVARAVFGMYGSYFIVFSRAVLSVVYYAIKLYIGSNFVKNILRAIFGDKFTGIPNQLPESAGITTQGMMAFVLYWLIHIPITFLRPNQMKWIFTLKMWTILPAYIGLFIFCMVNTKGKLGGGLKSESATTGWFIMAALNAGIGNTANTITNQADYTRWSRGHWQSVWPQLIANPIAVTISSSMGILATSAINNVWGLELWNQWDLLDEIMNRYWRSDVRFAVLLCAVAQALLVLGTNVAGNIIPFGSDSAMLWPRYINITRGQFLGLILAWAVIPWKILSDAQTFTTFLGGYGLFMGAVVGPTLVDYYYLTKGNVYVPELYNGSSSNKYYWYKKGWSAHAYIAYLIGIALPFPGFVGTLGVKVPETAVHIANIGWLLSLFVSAFAYLVLCLLVPTPAQKAIKEQKLGWEELSREPSDVLHSSPSVEMAADVNDKKRAEVSA